MIEASSWVPVAAVGAAGRAGAEEGSAAWAEGLDISAVGNF